MTTRSVKSISTHMNGGEWSIIDSKAAAQRLTLRRTYARYPFPALYNAAETAVEGSALRLEYSFSKSASDGLHTKDRIGIIK